MCRDLVLCCFELRVRPMPLKVYETPAELHAESSPQRCENPSLRQRLTSHAAQHRAKTSASS